MNIFKKTKLAGAIVIEPEIYRDERGFFLEMYRDQVFTQHGLPGHFVQANYSGSRQGTLRGLHYQIQQTQGKLIQAVVGTIFDVAVDIRRSSPGFGQWVGEELSADNRKQFWIPPGFAHGFYVLSEWAEVYYQVTDYYAPEWERSILWNDPTIGIRWPLVGSKPPTLSSKDAAGLPLDQAEIFN